MFSYNGDIIHSYDVCANCEAHAILLQLNKLPLQVNNLSNEDLKLITDTKFSTLLNGVIKLILLIVRVIR